MNVAAVRRHALSLAGVEESPHVTYASFRVGGRIFVTVPPEETHIHVFVGDDDRDLALALYGDCVEKLFWGGKAVGVRVALGDAEPAVVKRLIEQAWTRKSQLKPARPRQSKPRPAR